MCTAQTYTEEEVMLTYRMRHMPYATHELQKEREKENRIDQTTAICWNANLGVTTLFGFF